MTKQEVVENVAERCGLSKAQAGRTVDAILDSLTEAMADGEEVSFTGFGKFLSQRRRARQAVNPRDPSQKIRVRAANVPKFRPGTKLREAVSQLPADQPAAGSNGASSGAAQTPRPASSREAGDWRPLGERQ